jgi:hypothetical protein
MKRFPVLLANAALGMALISNVAVAQQFHLYLRCNGKLTSTDKPTLASLELAMRDNNQTALVQRSDLLPVGERLRYVATEQAYSMQMRTPVYGTTGVYTSWFHTPIFVWHPNLRQLSMTRISIDRQSGVLQGEMLNIAGDVLARMHMDCVPTKMDDVAPPRF